ncbi:hypothetical protein WEN_00040 [Mycoplasma wenyonii str. Massachusetts]|uniref:Uncharacterized protein n=1 Tax=Mycoplasma wenyonii (strain Massachusetts) TaxID=1197325 RepID=I6Z5J9_MYCWM|nr:hypothetical protein WEN_00040 [Mycoplasma wenyonii str. Massachusetts]
MDSVELRTNQEEYSWLRMHCRNFKNKSISFVEEFIKNFHRIQWMSGQRVFRETCFVLIITGILTSFFYLIFLFMWLIT